MEERYQQTRSKLSERKITHPNFSTMWLKYIEAKRENLLASLLQCENALEKIKEMDDIQPSTLMLLLLLIDLKP
jgi:hypothetical protein